MHFRPSASSEPFSALPASGDHFVFIAERLWLDFVNSDDTEYGRVRPSHDRAPLRLDAFGTFDGFVRWLGAAGLLDDDRAAALLRRAQQQPTGASAVLHEARRLRNVLRALAEQRGGTASDRATQIAIAEINRFLGRSAGSRRVETRVDGGFTRNFVTGGDVFAGLLIPVIESAAEALVNGELGRVRRCADPRCPRVFYDSSRNGTRRWCDMATCGNRAKAARHRQRLKES